MFKAILGIFVVSFAVAIQVQALMCFKCEGATGAGACGMPGGQKSETCPQGQNYCEFVSANNKPTRKGCTNITAIPDGFKKVQGDPQKSCMKTKGDVSNICYCTENRCNDNDKAFNAGISSFQSAGAGMLLLAAVHFFVC
eukprot:GFUD01012400.1.p1 GENE.GFUD01012400.1~~GFUD01012400.1.p1  ORF type:complete len:140 (-),score=24.66 GFUD01012400.1:189-608(-)